MTRPASACTTRVAQQTRPATPLTSQDSADARHAGFVTGRRIRNAKDTGRR
jgi:hypothetical protein